MGVLDDATDDATGPSDRVPVGRARVPAADPATVVRAGTCDGCGYTRFGLASHTACPECGVVPAVDPVAAAASDRRLWRWCVGLGLALWLLASWSALGVTLIVNLNRITLGAVNAPAPKLWTTALLRRAVGYRVEQPGVDGTLAAIGCCLAVWLMTCHPPGPGHDEAAADAGPFALRRLTRGAAVLATGGALGLFVGGWVIVGDRLRDYATCAILLGVAEAPADWLIYRYLCRLAAGEPLAVRRSLARSAWQVPLLAGCSAAGVLALSFVDRMHVSPWPEIGCWAFGAVATAVGLDATAGVLRLTLNWWGRLPADVPWRPGADDAAWAVGVAGGAWRWGVKRLVPLGLVLFVGYGTYVAVGTLVRSDRQGAFGALPFAGFFGPQFVMPTDPGAYDWQSPLTGFGELAAELGLVLLMTAPVPGERRRAGVVRRGTRSGVFAVVGAAVALLLSNWAGGGPQSFEGLAIHWENGRRVDTALAASTVLAVVIAGVNVPLTLALYAQIALRVRWAGDRRLGWRVMAGGAVATGMMLAGLALLLAGRPLFAFRSALWLAATTAAFGVLSAAAGLWCGMTLLKAAARLSAAAYDPGDDPRDPRPRPQ